MLDAMAAGGGPGSALPRAARAVPAGATGSWRRRAGPGRRRAAGGGGGRGAGGGGPGGGGAGGSRGRAALPSSAAGPGKRRRRRQRRSLPARTAPVAHFACHRGRKEALCGRHVTASCQALAEWRRRERGRRCLSGADRAFPLKEGARAALAPPSRPARLRERKAAPPRA